MAHPKAPKKTKPVLLTRARPVRDFEKPLPEPLRKKALELIDGYRQPSEATFKSARENIEGLINATSPDSRDPERLFLFLLSCVLSGRPLPGYSTLDYSHVKAIRDVLEKISRYTEDSSQTRPLNFLMLASPGAGKSHFIRCIAGELGAQRIGAVTYNMVGLQRHEDLIPPLDAARNFKVEDRLPLLFLDEFDVDENHYPILLPLMWDGQLTLGQHELKLGKVVVILAGSSSRLPGAIDQARSMKKVSGDLDSHHPKLVDLLSRINGGVLSIPELSAERAADKVCIGVNLLRQRFGRNLQVAPLGLLRFIAKANFRYGVRSIAHLIDLIPAAEDVRELKLNMLALPLKSVEALKTSSLAYHLLCDDQAHGVVQAWQESARVSVGIPIDYGSLDYRLLRRAEYRMRDPEYLDHILRRAWFDFERDLPTRKARG